MSEGVLAAGLSAVWLGILTSVSPCPLATNIAAVSFISKTVEKPRSIMVRGLLYTMGRILAYAILGIILAAGILTVFDTATVLQKWMNPLLGFILIGVGLVLLEIIPFPSFNSGLSERHATKLAKSGPVGALALGLLFALSFCPVSAALFFGSLLPLALQTDSSLLIPTLYGIGTALPVLGFAFAFGFGLTSVGRAFNRLTRIATWVKRLTALIFIAVGLYYIYLYVFPLIA